MTDVHYTLVLCEFGDCVCGYPGGCVHSRFQNLEMKDCMECSQRSDHDVHTWHTGGKCIRCMRRDGLVK